MSPCSWSTRRTSSRTRPRPAPGPWPRPSYGAQRALFLTGTPMENRVEEFRNLVGYLRPEVAARVDARDVLAGARGFRRAVAPVYLRRNQEDVLDELPEKIEVEDWVLLSPEDETAYADGRPLPQPDGDAAGGLRRSHLGQARAAGRAGRGGRRGRHEGRGLLVLPRRARRRRAPRSATSVVGRITGAVPPTARQQLVDDFTGRPGHCGAAGADRGRRCRHQHAGGLGGDSHRAAVEAEHRGPGGRPGPPDGPGPHRPGAPAAGQGQRRRADARGPGEQGAALRRLRPGERRQGRRRTRRGRRAAPAARAGRRSACRWSAASCWPRSTGCCTTPTICASRPYSGCSRAGRLAYAS